MEDRQVTWPLHQLGVKVEVKVETAVGLHLVDLLGHEQVSSVMVALRFNQIAIKFSLARVLGLEPLSEDLELFATAPLDHRRA